ncbi:FAD-linked oxidoreductase OXR1 [Physcia stellaris]|nr:FAD-linked oxidoreductase OXR1 [Physcia stellaris]
MNLDGVAIITGAGSGIGRDCGLAYAAAGAIGVVFADINLTSAQLASEDSKIFATNASYRTIALAVDVSSEESMNAMVEKAVGEFGRIDYAVSSAGIGVERPAEIAEADVREFESFFNVNVKGSLLFVKAVSKVMKQQSPRHCRGRTGPRDLGRGTIINVASCSSFVPTLGIVQYTSAKHALMGITKNAALDNAPYGIRVNAVCPSWVQTPMMDRAFDGSPALRESVNKAVPMGRIALQEEVSDVIIFLSGAGGSYVTGVGWIIDGGTTLQMHL